MQRHRHNVKVSKLLVGLRPYQAYTKRHPWYLPLPTYLMSKRLLLIGITLYKHALTVGIVAIQIGVIDVAASLQVWWRHLLSCKELQVTPPFNRSPIQS